MTNRSYTKEEKKYLAQQAIAAVLSLDGDYPSFKNYIWTAQCILNGKEPKTNIDVLVTDSLTKLEAIK